MGRHHQNLQNFMLLPDVLKIVGVVMSVDNGSQVKSGASWTAAAGEPAGNISDWMSSDGRRPFQVPPAVSCQLAWGYINSGPFCATGHLQLGFFFFTLLVCIALLLWVVQKEQCFVFPVFFFFCNQPLFINTQISESQLCWQGHDEFCAASMVSLHLDPGLPGSPGWRLVIVRPPTGGWQSKIQLIIRWFWDLADPLISQLLRCLPATCLSLDFFL